MPSNDSELRELKEKLADIEHERWADWQKWCHKVLREELRYNDMETNLEEILARWEKQIATPYAELSDKEKASDMEQVDRYWPLIEALIQQRVAEARDSERNRVYAELRHFNVPFDGKKLSKLRKEWEETAELKSLQNGQEG